MMIWPEENKWLKELPVAKSLEKYNLEENFCLVAATGSGKTMVLAPAISIKTKRKIILRQPTRQIAWLVYSSLKKFWGNKLTIGIRTSEQKIGTLEENDITVVTDGVLRTVLKDNMYAITVVFDEAHWLHEPTEIELGIVKTLMNKGHDIRCCLLSATIRPENFLVYFEDKPITHTRRAEIKEVCDALDKGEQVNQLSQNQKMKCYFAEGIVHPVKKMISHTDDNLAIQQFIRRMQSSNKRGLVFLTTRKEAENASKKCKAVASEFCHADRDIEEIKTFVEENEPCVLFSTVSMATSATLPFDEVLIIDRGLESDWKDSIKILRTNEPIDDNGIIQRAGRVGRVKPGIAFLNTRHTMKNDLIGRRFSERKYLRQKWDDIKPRQVEPPLEKLPLDMVVLTCASYNLSMTELDLLSNLDMTAMKETAKELEKRGIIYLRTIFSETEESSEPFDETLELTKLGKRINSMQMGVWPAFSLCMANSSTQPAILASQCAPNLFGLFSDENGMTRWSKDRTRFKTISLFKAELMQEILSQKPREISEWCERKGLNEKSVKNAIWLFKDRCKKSLKINWKKAKEDLLSTDLTKIEEEIIEHIRRNEQNSQYHLDYSQKWGYNCNAHGLWCLASGDESKVLNMPFGGYATILASPKRITTKKGKEMIILENITVEDVN